MNRITVYLNSATLFRRLALTAKNARHYEALTRLAEDLEGLAALRASMIAHEARRPDKIAPPRHR